MMSLYPYLLLQRCNDIVERGGPRLLCVGRCRSTVDRVGRFATTGTSCFAYWSQDSQMVGGTSAESAGTVCVQ